MLMSSISDKVGIPWFSQKVPLRGLLPIKRPIHFLGVHSTGPQVSEAVLSQREAKLTQLAEIGASKKRIGQSLARWIGLATIAWTGTAYAQTCESVLGEYDDSFTTMCFNYCLCQYDEDYSSRGQMRSRTQTSSQFAIISRNGTILEQENVSVCNDVGQECDGEVEQLVFNESDCTLNPNTRFYFKNTTVSDSYYYCDTNNQGKFQVGGIYTPGANIPPIFDTFGPFEVAENTSNGEAVGTVVAHDSDENDEITYRITAGNTFGTYTAFTINSSTGVITVNEIRLLDYEGRWLSGRSFKITVQADDGQASNNTADLVLTVNITNVNDAPIVYGEGVSGETVVGQVLSANGNFGDYDASDTPENGTLSYQWHTSTDSSCTEKTDISGATNATFTVTNSESGQFVCVTITATDDENLSGTPVTVTTATSVPQVDTVATLDDQTRAYGAENPPATFSYTNGATGIETPPTATFPDVNANVGTYEITCTGGEDDRYNITSCESGTFTITPATTTVAIDSHNPDPSARNEALTVNFTVTPASGTNPTGEVIISDGTDSCTQMLSASDNGSGSCDMTFRIRIGTKTLIATYAGDQNFQSSTSAPETHTVGEAGIVIDESSNRTIITTEGSGNETYTIQLWRSEPSGLIEVSITPDGETEVGSDSDDATTSSSAESSSQASNNPASPILTLPRQNTGTITSNHPVVIIIMNQSGDKHSVISTTGSN